MYKTVQDVILHLTLNSRHPLVQIWRSQKDGGSIVNMVPRDSMPLHRRAEEKVVLEKAASVFASLSNPVRLGVLLRLVKREWSVSELALDLEISQSALSQHLGKLRQAGIVRSRRNAQTVFYRCDNHTVIRLLAEAGLTQ